MSLAMATITDEQASFLARFGFREFDVETTLEGGMFSQPLALWADGRRYVLRTHTFRKSVDAFRFQAEAIAAAADRGVPCARVLRLRDGTWCQPAAGGHGVLAVHEFVDGRTDDWLAWHERKGSPQFLRDLGKQTARLHNVLRVAQPGGDPTLSIDLPPILFDCLSAIRRQWDRDLDQLALSQSHSPSVRRLLGLRQRIGEHWQVLQETLAPHLPSLPRQIVHGDVSPVNLIAGRHGWAFIDWDCVHVGWRLYDALGDVLNRPPMERPDLNSFRADQVAAYLQGYAEALDEPLTDSEKAMVPAFCLARQLEDLRQRVRALPGLADEVDAEYAILIARRVDMLDQIVCRGDGRSGRDYFEE